MFRSWLAFGMMAALLCGGVPQDRSELPAADKPPALNAPAPRTDLYGDPLPEGAVARLGTVRLRHSDTVDSVTFSPDGKLLARGSWDGTIGLWETATGKEIRSLNSCHWSRIHSVAFRRTVRTTALRECIHRTVESWDVRDRKGNPPLDRRPRNRFRRCRFPRMARY